MEKNAVNINHLFSNIIANASFFLEFSPIFTTFHLFKEFVNVFILKKLYLFLLMIHILYWNNMVISFNSFLYFHIHICDYFNIF